MNYIGIIANVLIIAVAIVLVIILKGKICYKRLSLTFIITYLMTLLPSCFENMQNFKADKSELLLGFPFDFYMIKYTVADTFAIHFNITGFVANIVVTYLVLTLCVRVWKKIKGEKQ